MMLRRAWMLRVGGVGLWGCVAALGRSAWAEEQRFPDVVGVRIRAKGPSTFDLDVTVSSPYDTPQRYADAFRATSEDGAVEYGVRPLAHDHAGEQPFTRDLRGLQIPLGVRKIRVQARDLQHGWGGGTRVVALPGR
ncbi:hypothetical protein [Hydrogenophaga sp. PAMC20947]|uniref:hypothetical protein n=1 Tax=Hydrogenophaga sp. PAMC20947 TaxID=2565558 RepID=UPI00109DFF37|nr:hypothetical protein [Hydrogenophaga sp. PAMC20947]QCB45080.1 hypothetical protein E5678_02955 [Hydrogenophaga sp. PAMC20947]